MIKFHIARKMFSLNVYQEAYKKILKEYQKKFRKVIDF